MADAAIHQAIEIAAFMIDVMILDLDLAKLFLGSTSLIFEELRIELGGEVWCNLHLHLRRNLQYSGKGYNDISHFGK